MGIFHANDIKSVRMIMLQKNVHCQGVSRTSYWIKDVFESHCNLSKDKCIHYENQQNVMETQTVDRLHLTY